MNATWFRRGCVLAVLCMGFTYAAQPQEVEMIVTADNPDPERLPSLGFWQKAKLTLVSASFPAGYCTIAYASGCQCSMSYCNKPGNTNPAPSPPTLTCTCQTTGSCKTDPTLLVHQDGYCFCVWN